MIDYRFSLGDYLTVDTNSETGSSQSCGSLVWRFRLTGV